MKTYRNDPRWITLKYDSRPNSLTGQFYPKGTRVLFYPNTGAVIGGEAAEQAWRDFEATCFDEQVQS
jgi:hypothetical protein